MLQREALALLKKSIYYTAPVTHSRVPKRSAGDTFKAAFDPEDNYMRAPKQSVSEQQTRSPVMSMHGLRIWQGILT